MILVDEEDEWLLDYLPWRVSTKGYVEATMYSDNGKQTVKLHHFIVGRPLHGLQVDHVDRDKLNNRRANLRYVSQSENIQNSERCETASLIYYRARNDRYEVRVTKDGRNTYIGSSRDLSAAERIRDEWLESELPSH